MFVDSGMYLGNQIDLLFHNYEERGDCYVGVGGYTLEGFAQLQASRPGAPTTRPRSSRSTSRRASAWAGSSCSACGAFSIRPARR